MNYDFEKYYQLTRPIVSDETKRARHFIVFICTVIIASYFLSLDLSKVKIAGIDLSDSSVLKVNIVALIVLGFWNFTLIINSKKDTYDAKERSFLITDEINKVQAEIDRQDNVISSGSKITFGNRDRYLDYLKKHQSQLNRMEKLNLFESIISKVNTYLPYCLSLIAALMLLRNIICSI